jgi:hypothetical protein
MIAGLMGPLFYRRWFSREPIDEQFIKRIVSNAIGGQPNPDAVSSQPGAS